jgi:uncharacterized protein YggE
LEAGIEFDNVDPLDRLAAARTENLPSKEPTMQSQLVTAIACLIVLFSTCTAEADGEPVHVRTISVTGLGQATAVPDMATIHTGVVTQAPLAVDAMEQNSQDVERLMAELKKLNVAEKDIQSSQFNVQPEYERGPRGERKPEIVGYRVTNQLRIQARDLSALGRLLDALIRAGSNQISGLTLGVDDSTKIMNEARIMAMANARDRAGLYANAAGVSVGQVLNISEQQIVSPQPRFYGQSMEAAAAGVPIAPGEQEFSATINVTFELVNKE